MHRALHLTVLIIFGCLLALPSFASFADKPQSGGSGGGGPTEETISPSQSKKPKKTIYVNVDDSVHVSVTANEFAWTNAAQTEYEWFVITVNVSFSDYSYVARQGNVELYSGESSYGSVCVYFFTYDSATGEVTNSNDCNDAQGELVYSGELVTYSDDDVSLQYVPTSLDGESRNRLDEVDTSGCKKREVTRRVYNNGSSEFTYAGEDFRNAGDVTTSGRFSESLRTSRRTCPAGSIGKG